MKAANRKQFKRSLLAACSVLAMSGGAGVTSATAEEAASSSIVKPIVDARLRYEHVDQDGFANDADAVTARVRAGLETRPYKGFSVLLEAEIVEGFTEDYNSTTNGRGAFPVVADPDNVELNRAQITYTGIDGVKFVGGRQRIILDDARFVGNVGWRQNEQTYDAALLEVTAIPDLKATYAYLSAVQRIFGNESPNGKFDAANSHIINLGYTGIPGISVGAYGYLFDLDEAPALSTQTYGVRASAKYDITEGIPIIAKAAYAIQSEYGDNPGNYDLDYYMASLGTKAYGFDASVTYEVLEGDSTRGFSTPLATLHKFQGWADVFLATPANGIEDLYGRVGYTSGKVGPFAKIIGAAIYHDFESENGGGSLGSEVDLLLKGVLNKKLSLTAKYANYDGPAGGPADREKLSIQVDWKL
ncbi:MAG: hypothetical protein R8J41_12370 [Alphaproteobacteria bacterium]|nr:hypothetical protein [Alphaproteobacteria bacterium]